LKSIHVQETCVVGSTAADRWTTEEAANAPLPADDDRRVMVM
jgi:hypothetical protein